MTDPEDRPLRIIRLAANNVMRIEAVEIVPDPDGSLVIVAGRNGQGKTSVLNAIWLALGGGDASRNIARAIRDGEDEASVRLDLGDLRVVRSWRRGKDGEEKTALKVESQDGTRKYGSPQAMLDALIGRLSFDPLAFANLPPREQVTTLLSLVDLPFDLDDVAARRRALFDERTVVGREAKQVEGQLAGLPLPRPDAPDEEVSVAALAAELAAAREAHGQRLARIERIERQEAEVARLARRVAEAQADLDGAEAQLANMRMPAPNDDEPLPDVADVERRLAGAEETNAAVRERKARRDVEARLRATRNEHDRLTEEIARLDAEKEAALQNAVMPIPGLSFDDDGVTYRGVPFKQSSAAEQLRVSVAMAMSLNPKVRVIRITDGSLLDADNMRLIEEMAGERGFQVWIERVDDSGDVGVVIEDGKVAPKRKAAKQ